MKVHQRDEMLSLIIAVVLATQFNPDVYTNNQIDPQGTLVNLTVPADLNADFGQQLQAQCYGPQIFVDWQYVLQSYYPVENFLCKDYIFNRSMFISPILISPNIFVNIAAADSQAKIQYQSRTINKNCNRPRAIADLCTMIFRPCTLLDTLDTATSVPYTSDWAPKPFCREFLEYTYGCHYDSIAVANAPRYDPTDPEACDVGNYAVVFYPH